MCLGLAIIAMVVPAQVFAQSGKYEVKGARTLFRYDVLDNTVDADGNIKITGKHTQCSDISDVLRKRMMENGISARELAAFTKEADHVD